MEETEHPSHLCLTRVDGDGICLSSNATGADPHTVHAFGRGSGARSPLPDPVDGLFHAIEMRTPTDAAPDLLTVLPCDLVEGARRFLLTFDPRTLTLTTSTD